MTESPMVFWKVNRLASEFKMGRHHVARLLKSIGAKKWAGSGGGHTAIRYWEDER